MELLQHNNLHRINPADLELERRFIHRLSPQTKRLRLLAAFGEPNEDQLIRLVSPNPETELALAWMQQASLNSIPALDGEFVAVARYAIVDQALGVAEFAIVVADEVQAQGLGRKLLRALIDASRAAGLKFLQGDCYADNRALRALCESLGFKVASHPEDASLARVSLDLNLTPARPLRITPLNILALPTKSSHAEDDPCYQ